MNTKEETTKWLRALSIGYDLDGGGYAFEEPPAGLKGLACAVWDDPDPDYIPWINDVEGGYYSLLSPLYVFAPNDGHFAATEWPKTFVDGDLTFERVADGGLSESDRECWCKDCDPHWTVVCAKCATRYTQEEKEKPQQCGACGSEFIAAEELKCDRCAGDGYVISHGGEWALYAVRIEEGAE